MQLGFIAPFCQGLISGWFRRTRRGVNKIVSGMKRPHGTASFRLIGYSYMSASCLPVYVCMSLLCRSLCLSLILGGLDSCSLFRFHVDVFLYLRLSFCLSKRLC